AARAEEIPYLLVHRPPWCQVPGDRWIDVANMTEAAEAIGPVGRRVFLTIGRTELDPFVARSQHWYLIRSVDSPEPEHLPHRSTVISARGPFDEADERALLARHRIDVLVSKNSGGSATAAKLAAARGLGIEVIMIARPALPDADLADDADSAWTWLLSRHGATASARRGV
ncbi:MAG: precorrin-6A/cobalt-precorrin-6A reductase, partial [Pseudomonadota bacterium]